jgi:PAS domain S-box-containing protein
MTEPKWPSTPGTILVVDDQDEIRYARSRVLRKAGLEVVEAATGAEALESAARLGPEVAILDVNLPDMSGIEVCRRLKSDPATSSILVLHLSATSVQNRDRVEGLEAGADNYLIEPVPPEVVVASVKALLRIRRAEQQVRSAAQEWQTTFDCINDAICLTDRQGMVLRVNRAMGTILGRPPEELAGENWRDLITGADGEAREVIARLLTSRGRETREIPLGDRWFGITVDQVPSSGGAVFILSDITDRRRAREEARSLLEREKVLRSEAEAANRTKDEFLATLSHEMRTPLQAMLGWLWLLRTGELDPGASREALDTVERNARLQARLIEDLLDISRIITGKLRLEMGPVSLPRVVKMALEVVQPAAAAREIEIHTRLDMEMAPIAGDANRLQQVIWNLLSNAVKFTPAGGRVEVSLGREEAEAVIRVSDTGKGISEAFLPYIFDRFRQADSSVSRSHSGLGLGLAIARHLVELHGGSIAGESGGEGKGATFTVHLPISKIFRFARPQTEGLDLPARVPSTQRRLAGLTLLAVEDEDDARKLLKLALVREGASVVAVSSAREALEAFRGSRPDIIVSDIAMPGEDGYSFIRKVREIEPDGARLPALALTAYARDTERNEAMLAGFQAHLAKPVDPADLIETLRRLASRKLAAP